MKNAICIRPNGTSGRIWGNSNGIKIIGPVCMEEVTITSEKVVDGTPCVRLDEYALPDNGWFEAKHFAKLNSNRAVEILSASKEKEVVAVFS